MKRLSILQKNAIKDFAKTSSLNEISARMSLPKSTVQYWYRRYSNYEAPKRININLESEEQIGEFIGAFAGDGNYTVDRNYKHQIRIYLTANDFAYINHLKFLVTRLFGKKPWVYTEPKKNVTQLRLVSKEGITFIRRFLQWSHTKTKTVRLNKRFKGNSAFLVGFLRGVMDTDGYLDIKHHTAVFSTISDSLAKNIEAALDLFGINFKCYRQIDRRPTASPIFRIVVRKDFQKFISIIKPYHVTNS